MSGPSSRGGVIVGLTSLGLCLFCVAPRLLAGERADLLEQGKAVYTQNCVDCHGKNGDGRGPKGKDLKPLPRNFTLGNFRFRSTRFGKLPLDKDLDRTIRVGIPGTDMDGFEKVLDADSRQAVIAYIKTFSDAWRDPKLAPGPIDIYDVPAERPFERTEKTIAKGRALYERFKCAACHGESGEGEGPGTRVLDDDQNQWLRPYDFSCGVYKSGTEERDLYRTIVTGTNGAEMRGYGPALTEFERWELVDYVVSLSEKRNAVSKMLACDKP